jgi:hypothetical protein
LGLIYEETGGDLENMIRDTVTYTEPVTYTEHACAALMDEFTMQGLYDKHMRDINICRIYLRAFYISDITDLAGKSIEDWARQGKRQAHRTRKWNWPVQQMPPAAAWENWQLTLQGIASEDGDLFQHLGP